MSPQEDAIGQHVPAWKKLGLKLKHAPETNGSLGADHDGGANEKKRKRSSDKDGVVPPAEPVKNQKRKKTKTEALKSRPDSSNPDASQPSARSSISTSPPDQEEHTPPRSKAPRKSVSFTPDTKTTDGDSVKQFYRTWLYSHLAKDPSFRPATANPALRLIAPTTISPSRSSIPTTSAHQTTTTTNKKAQKKPRAPTDKNHKRQESSSSSSSAHQSSLTYLQTYHTSRSQWKFSKSRQIHLLHNLFCDSFIPFSFQPALQAYLSGLQGEGAKSRLRSAAQKIRAEGSRPGPHGPAAANTDGDNDEARAQHREKQKPEDSSSDMSKDTQTKNEETHNTNALNQPNPNPDPESPTNPKIPYLLPTQIADLVLQTIPEPFCSSPSPPPSPSLPQPQPQPQTDLLLSTKPTNASPSSLPPVVNKLRPRKNTRGNKIRALALAAFDDDDSESSSSSNKEE